MTVYGRTPSQSQLVYRGRGSKQFICFPLSVLTSTLGVGRRLANFCTGCKYIINADENINCVISAIQKNSFA